ncbi:hypothetical protein ACIRBX_24950 [Kitasatospora sp. NPDC096147]|uniref:hypothetical protein n=1 Tax=Kitasatospora sp. NPDC096147 TaxID=3364093 RepID=UPI00381CB8CD
MPTPGVPQFTPDAPDLIADARDKHRAAAADATSSNTSREHHARAACAYDWALKARQADPRAAARHLGYARAHAEQAAQHATSSSRHGLRITLPGPFIQWFTTTDLYRNGYTGDEAADRLLLAYNAGLAHRSGAEPTARTIPGHDPLAMETLLQLTKAYLELPSTQTPDAEEWVRALITLTEQLNGIADRQIKAYL